MSSYLGQAPVFGDFPSQVLTGNGGASYTLNYQVPNENGMLVFLNGAVQRPGVDFAASGNSLVFSEGVASGVQIFTYGMGLPKSMLSTSAGSINTAQLAGGIYANTSEAQDWTNATKLLSPKGLSDAFKGGNQSLAANGYQKLPGGLILQWGQMTTVTNPTNTSFPITFPTACVNVNISGRIYPAAYYQENSIANVTTSGFTSYHDATGLEKYWIAIGY